MFLKLKVSVGFLYDQEAEVRVMVRRGRPGRLVLSAVAPFLGEVQVHLTNGDLIALLGVCDGANRVQEVDRSIGQEGGQKS